MSKVLALIAVVWFLVAFFVGTHASENEKSGLFWFFVVLITGIIGVILYVVTSDSSGSPPKRVCPECNIQNATDANYCSDCGTRMPIPDEANETDRSNPDPT